jgi:hypothetical protein
MITVSDEFASLLKACLADTNLSPMIISGESRARNSFPGCTNLAIGEFRMLLPLEVLLDDSRRRIRQQQWHENVASS